MSDGTSLNAKLAAMMPLAPDDVGPAIRSIRANPETQLEEGAEYSFVITPASGDMAGYAVGINDTLSSEEGAPLSGSVSVVDGDLDMRVFSYHGFEEDEGDTLPKETASVAVYTGGIQ